jgi:hypothetical protein
MKKSALILGHHAPAPRLTKAAALLLATALSVPVFLCLSLLELIMF